MKTVKIGQKETSVIGMGCMRIADLSVEKAQELIKGALDCGITLFDHADIYGKGKSESLFGQVLKRNPGWRDKMFIQSKCGIGRGYYDMSYEHIVHSTEEILQRLQIDTLDMLLFHRPDALAEQEEVAKAVQQLKQQGKVRQFGVSNMNPAQIELLESWTGERFAVNQLQLSLLHAGMVSSGINVNVENNEGTVRDGGALPFCQKNGITVQAWSPLQFGMFGGCFVGNKKFPQLNDKLNEIAEKYNVTPAAVALAWILRIPGNMQIILGTTKLSHMQANCAAVDFELTRQEWYSLYSACGYPLP